MYDFSYKMQASSNYMRLFIRFFVQKRRIFTLGRNIRSIFRIKPLAVGMDTDTDVRDILEAVDSLWTAAQLSKG